MQCRGCWRESPARTVRGQTCDKCEHSTEAERRIVKAKVRAAFREHQKGWLQLFLPVAEDGIGRFMGDGGSV